MDPKPKRVPEDKQATEFLANERTFLAWIRTSVSIISLGFVIAKFKIWLQEMSQGSNPGIHQSGLGESLQIGIGMMSVGGLLAILAAWRYHVVNRQIEEGKVTADRGLIILVTLLVAGLVVAMILTNLASGTGK